MEGVRGGGVGKEVEEYRRGDKLRAEWAGGQRTGGISGKFERAHSKKKAKPRRALPLFGMEGCRLARKDR